MRYAFDVPNFGEYGDVRLLAELAHEAEETGWDGFFVWDHLVWPGIGNVVDPWIALAAIALRTERVAIGAMVTPLPRRRPWKLARETATLDRLSGGRLIVGVGLGVHPEEFGALGEEADPRRRADMLDEGLAVLTGLWSGEPFAFAGEHYRVEAAPFTPTPIQTPRPPVWVAGTWPRPRPLRRAARWDAYFPIKADGGGASWTPDEVGQMVAALRTEGAPAEAFDLVLGGWGAGLDPADHTAAVAALAEAGATWWLESPRETTLLAEARARLRFGPPR